MTDQPTRIVRTVCDPFSGKQFQVLSERDHVGNTAARVVTDEEAEAIAKAFKDATEDNSVELDDDATGDVESAGEDIDDDAEPIGYAADQDDEDDVTVDDREPESDEADEVSPSESEDSAEPETVEGN